MLGHGNSVVTVGEDCLGLGSVGAVMETMFAGSGIQIQRKFATELDETLRAPMLHRHIEQIGVDCASKFPPVVLLETLKSCGYLVEHRVLDSRKVCGSPKSRRRWYCVCILAELCNTTNKQFQWPSEDAEPRPVSAALMSDEHISWCPIGSFKSSQKGRVVPRNLERALSLHTDGDVVCFDSKASVQRKNADVNYCGAIPVITAPFMGAAAAGGV